LTADFGKDSVISDQFDQPVLFLALFGVDRMTADFGKDSVISDQFDQPVLFLVLFGVDRSVSSPVPLFLFSASGQHAP